MSDGPHHYEIIVARVDPISHLVVVSRTSMIHGPLPPEMQLENGIRASDRFAGSFPDEGLSLEAWRDIRDRLAGTSR